MLNYQRYVNNCNTAAGLADRSWFYKSASQIINTMTNLNAELYDALLEARVKEPTARAAAQATVANDQVATKADILEMKSEVNGQFARMQSKLNTLANAQSEINERFSKMETNIATAQSEADKRFSKMETNIITAQSEADKRFSKMETNIVTAQSEADKRFSKMETNLATAQSEANNRFSKMETNIATAQSETDKRFSKIETSIATIAAIQQEQRWLLRTLFVGVAGILIKLFFFSS